MKDMKGELSEEESKGKKKPRESVVSDFPRGSFRLNDGIYYLCIIHDQCSLLPYFLRNVVVLEEAACTEQVTPDAYQFL